MKKSLSLWVLSFIAVSAVLAGCGGSGSASPSGASTAALATTKASVEMVADSGSPAIISIRNNSEAITATAIKAVLPADWTDVTQDASACATLAPQDSCSLTLTPGSVSHPAAQITISGIDADPFTVTLAVSASSTATITTSGTPLSLVAGGGSAAITVKNTSATVTAIHISADLAGTPLAAAVTQDASDCLSVAPGASCSLQFTPKSVAVTLTDFPIRGDNTRQAGGSIAVMLAQIATLSISGSPLTLQATTGTPVSGTITVTNTSTDVTATGVSADLFGTALDASVTQNASGCLSLAPGASCTLTFAAGSVGLVSTSFVIQGTNASQVGASIAVNAPAQASLNLAATTLKMLAYGGIRTVVVTNTSTTETATGIGASFTGTALAGRVSQTGNTCANVAPGASCTLTLTPGSLPVAQTSFTIAGANTQAINADLTIQQLQIGDTYAGGIVFQIPTSSSQIGKVITSDEVTNLSWSPTTAALTGARSNTDGVANSAAILAAIGNSASYEAGYCDAYSATSGGTTYGDWYLPAITELESALDLSTARSGPIGGFAYQYYVSSTEYSGPNFASIAQPASPGASAGVQKTAVVNIVGTRCISTVN